MIKSSVIGLIIGYWIGREMGKGKKNNKQQEVCGHSHYNDYTCTRDKNHKGPCALVLDEPNYSNQMIYDRLVTLRGEIDKMILEVIRMNAC